MENSDKTKFRKYQMALLNYHIYKLNKKFNTGEVSDEPIKCFLVDKNRLNSLKSDNNYSDASRYFNTNIERYLNNYQRFRDNLFKAMGKENSFYEDYKKNDKINNEIQLINIEDVSQINNISLIPIQFFEEFSQNLNQNLSYTVYLGNKIIVIKPENKYKLYIYKLDENKNKEQDLNNDINIEINDFQYEQYEQEFASEEDTNKRINEITKNNCINIDNEPPSQNNNNSNEQGTIDETNLVLNNDIQSGGEIEYINIGTNNNQMNQRNNTNINNLSQSGNPNNFIGNSFTNNMINNINNNMVNNMNMNMNNGSNNGLFINQNAFNYLSNTNNMNYPNYGMNNSTPPNTNINMNNFNQMNVFNQNMSNFNPNMNTNTNMIPNNMTPNYNNMGQNYLKFPYQNNNMNNY